MQCYLMWRTKLQALPIDPGGIDRSLWKHVLLLSLPLPVCCTLEAIAPALLGQTLRIWQWQPGPKQTLTNTMSTSQLGTKSRLRYWPDACLLKSSYTNHLWAIHYHYWKLLASLIGKNWGKKCRQTVPKTWSLKNKIRRMEGKEIRETTCFFPKSTNNHN